MFDRKVYFDAVRKSMFDGSMSQQQVDGQNALLSQWETQTTGTPMDDLRWLAYILATTYHETAQTMWPIEEYGKGSGKPYGKVDPQTGQAYYGRGFVQLTWRDNYHKATVNLSLTGDLDLEWHPEKALDLVIASRIIFRGMAEGWFTGKKLGQYFNTTKNDPVNARQIVNGNDDDTLIAGYHEKFLTAVYDSWSEEPMPENPVVLVALTVPVGVEVTVTINGEIIGA